MWLLVLPTLHAQEQERTHTHTHSPKIDLVKSTMESVPAILFCSVEQRTVTLKVKLMSTPLLKKAALNSYQSSYLPHSYGGWGGGGGLDENRIFWLFPTIMFEMLQ